MREKKDENDSTKGLKPVENESARKNKRGGDKRKKNTKICSVKSAAQLSDPASRLFFFSVPAMRCSTDLIYASLQNACVRGKQSRKKERE